MSIALTSLGDSKGVRQYPFRLSACFIVRDRAGVFEPCLASLRPWVDELVVVDTGSTDNTPEIALQYGARLFHFPWCDDFSAARNVSLKHARGEWLFWMDSDDTIDPECGSKLRQLADGPHPPEVLAYVMQVHCPGAGEERGDVTVVDHVKMFRNLAQIRFEGRIHEQVLPTIRALGGEVAWSDIFVVHSGADHSEEGRQQKIDRDLRLLDLDLRERPDHPFVLFNYGMTYADIGEHEQAVQSLERCLEVSGPQESHVRKAFALLVNSLTQLERYDQAWSLCQKARKLFSDDPELSFRAGMLFHQLGRPDESIEAYRGAMRGGDRRHFSSMDCGVMGHKARHNMAVVYRDMGRLDLAEIQWRVALEERSDWRPAVRYLGEMLVQQGKFRTAEIHAESLLNNERLHSEGLLIQAALAEAAGDLPAAYQALEKAVETAVDNEPLQRLCRLLFEHGPLEEAQRRLSEMIEQEPDDGAAHHNLGVVHLRLGRVDQAETALRNSLRVRPNSRITHEQLAAVLELAGDVAGAEESMAEARKCELAQTSSPSAPTVPSTETSKT